MNTLQVVAKITIFDIQLSLTFSPAESGLNLDFYLFAITLVGKKKKYFAQVGLLKILSIMPKYLYCL